MIAKLLRSSLQRQLLNPDQLGAAGKRNCGCKSYSSNEMPKLANQTRLENGRCQDEADAASCSTGPIDDFEVVFNAEFKSRSAEALQKPSLYFFGTLVRSSEVNKARIQSSVDHQKAKIRTHIITVLQVIPLARLGNCRQIRGMKQHKADLLRDATRTHYRFLSILYSIQYFT